MSKLSECLLRHIDASGLSLRKVAEEAGVSFSHLAKAARGELTPRAPFLDALAPVIRAPFTVLLFLAGHLQPRYDPHGRWRVTPKLARLKPYSDLIAEFLGEIFGTFEEMALWVYEDAEIMEQFLEMLGDEHLYQAAHEDNTDKPGQLRHVGAILHFLILNRHPRIAEALITLSTTGGFDPDDVFFVLDMIPPKFFSEKHTPRFAQKLKWQQEWLEYSIAWFQKVDKDELDLQPYRCSPFWHHYLQSPDRVKFLRRAYITPTHETIEDHEEGAEKLQLRIRELGNGKSEIVITLPSESAPEVLPKLAELISKALK
ncbi:MAG: hypothetical protein XD69_0404 [Clostridia bacterium 62_21]|nr:MAG: hypothetical protein XD69_0404 [Clostridia bacterium 62_21]